MIDNQVCGELMGLRDAPEVLPAAEPWVNNFVVNRIEAGIVAIVRMEEGENVNTSEVYWNDYQSYPSHQHLYLNHLSLPRKN